jgi:hypothetical protein
MPLIAPAHIRTKRDLIAAVAADPDQVLLEDPSTVMRGGPGVLSAREAAALDETVTNHPKRSWFAALSVRNGKVVVK